uniref:DUF5899 domain-containing protein n=1 Tax=viral metagenome TaxID=1070528 RepID=A0A6C0EAK0_9ZZZZ
MDLLSGVAFAGSLLQNNDKPKTQYPKKHKSSDRHNKTIYSSAGIKRADDIVNKLASDRYHKSKNPDKTGVIPQLHNRSRKRQKKNTVEHFGNSSDSQFSDSEFSDSQSMCSDNSVGRDPTYLFDKAEQLLDNRFHERKIVPKTRDNNNYLSQFDDLKFDNTSQPSSYNAVNGSTNTTSRIERERELALDGGYSNFGETSDMTYGVVGREHFTHNNMIPNFKGRSYGSNPLAEKQTSKISQRKMELFTGSLNDPSYRTKTENKPLFGPLKGVTNIFGMPSTTNFMDDRYNPSQYKQNELPFRQIKVSPGLGLGYNEVGKGGYVDTYRVLPKTVDELRTANNPKVSYEGRTVDGMKGQKGPVIGRVNKKLPERFAEWGTDRMLPSLGYIRAPTIYGKFDPDDLATKNRGLLKRVIYGPARSGVDGATPEKLREESRVPFKQNYKQADPRNIMLVEGQQARGEHNTYIPDPTKRGLDNKYIGPLSNNSKGHVYDPNDMPDMTKRNIHGKTDRNGTAITGNAYKGQTFDPNDIPDITKRNVHNKYDRNGTAITGNAYKGQIYDPNDIPDITKRNIHNKYDRNGVAITGNAYKGQTFDPNDIPDITKRNIHNKYDRNGAAITGNAYKGQTYDPNDIPDITKRNIHNKYDRNGTAITGNAYKGQTFDPNDIPDITKRNIHNKYDRSGTAISGNMYKGQTYDPNDIPDITKRNIHDKYDRSGKAITGNAYKGQSFDPNDIPDVTKRNIHNKYDRSGKAISGNMYKGQTYDPNDVPDVTKRNIHGKTDRSGKAMTGDFTKARAIDFNDVPDLTNRAMHGKLDRTGGGAKSENAKGYAINYVDVTPDLTKREIHGKQKYVAPAKSQVDANRNRADANNMQINTAKEEIIKGRAPTRSNSNRGPTIDFTEFEFCKKIEMNREPAPNFTNYMKSTDYLPSMQTHVPMLRTVENTRMDSSIKNSLQGNPYINNLFNQSF